MKHPFKSPSVWTLTLLLVTIWEARAQTVTSKVTPEQYDRNSSAGLFIGVGHFLHLADIPYAVDDAVDLAHAFIYQAKLINPQKAQLCLSGEPQKAESKIRFKELIAAGCQVSEATLTNMKKVMTVHVNQTKDAGLILVSIACHGFSQKGVHYLAARDTDTSFLPQTALSLDHIIESTSQAPALRRLLLVDACRQFVGPNYSGGDGEPMSIGFLEAMQQAQGLAILSGATVGGFAYYDKTRGNGVFTAGILAGLQGQVKADSRTGCITLFDLSLFVDEWVKNWQRQHNLKELGISATIEGAMKSFPLSTETLPLISETLIAPEPTTRLGRKLFRTELVVGQIFHDPQGDIDIEFRTSKLGSTLVASMSVTAWGQVKEFGFYGPTSESLNFGEHELLVTVTSLDLSAGKAVVLVSQADQK